MSEAEGSFGLERARVRASFERASARYESSAKLQADVAHELLARLEPFRFAPAAVLDLGAGTGRVTRVLRRRYRGALVVALDLAPGMLREARRHSRPWRRFERVCGDAMRLPFADASLDVIFSNLMLQWCEPLDPALAEVRRVLKPQGFFLFSTFGTDTLHELRSAWAETDGYTHVNHFADVHEIGDALVRAGLMEPVLDVDRIELGFPDVLALMRDLKAIGAHNVTAGRPRALTGRGRLDRLRRAYEGFRRNGALPATYEVVYGASWGAAGRPATAMHEGLVQIAPGSIGRARR
jgi:malonyl-CoA O-methyltransferase